jgi:hypothetical protein
MSACMLHHRRWILRCGWGRLRCWIVYYCGSLRELHRRCDCERETEAGTTENEAGNVSHRVCVLPLEDGSPRLRARASVVRVANSSYGAQDAEV